MRAKFNVAEITKYGNGGGTKITLFPSIVDNEENKIFSGGNVRGKITIHVSNPPEEFELGEYYIDFTKVDPTQKG